MHEIEYQRKITTHGKVFIEGLVYGGLRYTGKTYLGAQRMFIFTDLNGREYHLTRKSIRSLK